MAWQPYCAKAIKSAPRPVAQVGNTRLGYLLCSSALLAFTSRTGIRLAHSPEVTTAQPRWLGWPKGMHVCMLVAHTRIHPAQPVQAGPAVRWPVAHPLVPRTRDRPLLALARSLSPPCFLAYPTPPSPPIIASFLSFSQQLATYSTSCPPSAPSSSPSNSSPRPHPHVHSRCSSRPLPPSPSPPRPSPRPRRTSPSPPLPLPGGVSLNQSCERRSAPLTCKGLRSLRTSSLGPTETPLTRPPSTSTTRTTTSFLAAFKPSRLLVSAHSRMCAHIAHRLLLWTTADHLQLTFTTTRPSSRCKLNMQSRHETMACTLLTWHSPPGIKPAKGYFITIVDSIYQTQRE